MKMVLKVRHKATGLNGVRMAGMGWQYREMLQERAGRPCGREYLGDWLGRGGGEWS